LGSPERLAACEAQEGRPNKSPPPNKPVKPDPKSEDEGSENIPDKARLSAFWASAIANWVFWGVAEEGLESIWSTRELKLLDPPSDAKAPVLEFENKELRSEGPIADKSFTTNLTTFRKKTEAGK
jgi:hypothetical protein